jgi:hypothetical protein
MSQTEAQGLPTNPGVTSLQNGQAATAWPSAVLAADIEIESDGGEMAFSVVQGW